MQSLGFALAIIIGVIVAHSGNMALAILFAAVMFGALALPVRR